MAHSIYENRHYVIFNCNELNKIDFNQVLETSADTVRKSLDETKTFVKYEGEMPSSIVSLESKSQEYSHNDILAILDTNVWTDPNPQP